MIKYEILTKGKLIYINPSSYTILIIDDLDGYVNIWEVVYYKLSSYTILRYGDIYHMGSRFLCSYTILIINVLWRYLTYGRLNYYE